MPPLMPTTPPCLWKPRTVSFIQRTMRSVSAAASMRSTSLFMGTASPFG